MMKSQILDIPSRQMRFYQYQQKDLPKAEQVFLLYYQYNMSKLGFDTGASLFRNIATQSPEKIDQCDIGITL